MKFVNFSLKVYGSTGSSKISLTKKKKTLHANQKEFARAKKEFASQKKRVSCDLINDFVRAKSVCS